jgi:hypothetical protein
VSRGNREQATQTVPPAWKRRRGRYFEFISETAVCRRGRERLTSPKVQRHIRVADHYSPDQAPGLTSGGARVFGYCRGQRPGRLGRAGADHWWRERFQSDRSLEGRRRGDNSTFLWGCFGEGRGDPDRGSRRRRNGPLSGWGVPGMNTVLPGRVWPAGARGEFPASGVRGNRG